MNIGPIVPSNYVNDPQYQKDMDVKRPQPRIRPGDRWIKEVSEAGSIGVLIELQSLQSKFEELRVMERDRVVRSNRGEYPYFGSKDKNLSKRSIGNEKKQNNGEIEQVRMNESFIKGTMNPNIDDTKSIDRKKQKKESKKKEKIEVKWKEKEKIRVSNLKNEEKCNYDEQSNKNEHKKYKNEIIERDENKSDKEMNEKPTQHENRIGGSVQGSCTSKDNSKVHDHPWNKDTKVVSEYQKKTIFINELNRRSSSECKEYLRSHTVTGPPLEERYPPIKKIDLTDKSRIHAMVPTAFSAKMVKLQRREIDFVKANAYALDSGWYKKNLRGTGLMKEGSLCSDESKAEDNKRRLLSPSEQKEVRNKLTKELQSWYQELNHLPISMDTLRMKTKKNMIEDRIKQVEEYLELFSRGKVFVEQ